MSDRLTGYLCLTLAMMTVGATVTASKIIAGGMAPFTATALRFAVALLVFGLVLLAVRPALPRLPARIWGLLLVQAGAGSVGYTVLLIAGLSHMPSADAGVLIGTLPAVAALFSVLVLRERPERGLWAALGLATLGVAAVTGSGPPQVGLGAALVMGAVACESVFILLNKSFGTPLPPLWQATVMTALGLLVAAPFALLEGRTVAPEALGAVVFYALVPTVGGFLLWYAGAARVSGAEAALFTAAAPVTAVALAALWLGESVGPAQIAGMAAVVLAILLIARFPSRGA